MLLTGGACSVDNNDKDEFLDQLKDDYAKDNETKTILKGMAGYYSGVWTVDGKTVEPDNFGRLRYEKYAGYIAEQSSYPSYVQLHFDNSATSISWTEFPFKSLLKRQLPTLDVATLQVTIEMEIGGPLPADQKLLLQMQNFYIDERDNAAGILPGIPHSLEGYSADMAYLEFNSFVGSAYLHLPFVVTTTDGIIKGITLDVVPSMSTLTMNITSQFITFNLLIRQVEVFDEDMQRTIIPLNPEVSVSFISNQRSEKPIYK